MGPLFHSQNSRHFSDLHTESGLQSLNEFLSSKTYISGHQLTKDDIKVYAFVKNPSDAFPNASKWSDAVSSRLAERARKMVKKIEGQRKEPTTGWKSSKRIFMQRKKENSKTLKRKLQTSFEPD